MDKDIEICTIIGITIIGTVLAFILPVLIFANIDKQRDFELEKYKIEMQYKNGDVEE